MMTRSESINELAQALSKAQAKMQTAKKDALNPHFKSKYADLASVWDAARGPLTDNGLSVLQSPRLSAGDVAAVEVETLLMHSSGQWVFDTITVPVSKSDAQGVGSAITYARRYALAAFASVAPDDDDGNAAAAAAPRKVSQPESKQPPLGFDDWLTDFAAVADDGTDALADAWSKSKAEYRSYAQANRRTQIDTIKAKAAKVGIQ